MLYSAYPQDESGSFVIKLWESLSRAGEHVSDEALVDSIGFDTYYVALKLQQSIPRELRSSVKQLIIKFAEENGRAVQNVKIAPTFIEFLLTRPKPKQS
jgi:hypothetical protein